MKNTLYISHKLGMKTYNAIFYATLNNKQHIKIGFHNNNFRFVFSFRGIL